MKRVSIDSKLGEIFSLPIPDKLKRHYYVLVSYIKNTDKCLLFNFSSVKFNAKNKELPYDTSCVFDEKDNICYSNGQYIINKKSYIRYDSPIEIKYSDLLQKQSIHYCGTLNEEFVRRIITGALISKKIKPHIKYNYLNKNNPSNVF